MKRAIGKQKVVKSDACVVIDLVRLLEQDTVGTFVGIMRYKMREQWGKRVDNHIWLEFVKSRYVLGYAH